MHLLLQSDEAEVRFEEARPEATPRAPARVRVHLQGLVQNCILFLSKSVTSARCLSVVVSFLQ
jgi:hypothetical protein